MLTCGELGNLTAYGFAPASIVTPLGAVGVLVNCIITTMLLKEAVTVINFVGILTVIGGIITIVVFAPKSNIDIRSDTVVPLSHACFSTLCQLTDHDMHTRLLHTEAVVVPC